MSASCPTLAEMSRVPFELIVNLVSLECYLSDHPHVEFARDKHGKPIILNDDDRIHYLLLTAGQTS